MGLKSVWLVVAPLFLFARSCIFSYPPALLELLSLKIAVPNVDDLVLVSILDLKPRQSCRAQRCLWLPPIHCLDVT
eukprot:1779432-Amphidinium_carterae.1